MDDLNMPIWLGNSLSFSATNATRCRILVPPTPPKLVPAVDGELGEPYDASDRYAHARQVVLRGGARLMSGLVASTDGAAKSLLFYLGTHLATIGAGTHSIGSQNLLTIGGTGQWNPLTGANGVNTLDTVENRVQVGERLMLFKTDVDADGMGPNDGLVTPPVTAVDATSVTVSGTPWTNDAGLDSGFQVFRVGQATRKGIPANSGNADGTVPVNLMGGTQEADLPSQPDLGRQIGMYNAWIVGLVAAASALPASIDITYSYGRY